MAKAANIVLVTIVVAAGSIAILAWHAGRQPPATRVSSPAPSDPPASDLGNAAMRSEVLSPVARTSGAASTSIAADLVTLEGLLVVEDEAGSEHRSANGKFHARSGPLAGEEWQEHEIAVINGRWSCPVSATARFTAADPVLEGRAAVLVDPHADLAIPADRRISLVARWPPRTALRILDSSTGAELSLVTLVRCVHDWSDAPSQSPCACSTEIVSRAPSPITLAVPASETGPCWREFLWATALGYGWVRVEIDYERGGEHVARLLPTSWLGELEVSVTDFDRVEQVLAHFRARDAAPVAMIQVCAVEAFDRIGALQAEVAVRENAAPRTITSLLPGKYHVLLEVVDGGEVREDLAWLAEAVVELERGGRARVTLHPADDTLAVLAENESYAEPVPMSGTLFVPLAWDLDALELSFDASGGDGSRVVNLHDLQAVPGQAGRYRWDLGHLSPMRYTVRCRGQELAEIVLEPPGRDDIELTLPEPADVTVELIEAETGRVAPIDEFDSCPRNQATGRFEFRVPAGERWFTLWQKDYELEQERILLRPGANDLTLRVRRASGVEVVQKCGREIIPMTDGFSLRPLGGELEGGVSGPGWAKVPPGRYEVTIADVLGFRSVAPFPIEVKAGAFLQLEIELQER
ncbi:MAG: hypothetical protein U1E76_17665 [Planctomycetota bacterium]